MPLIAPAIGFVRSARTPAGVRSTEPGLHNDEISTHGGQRIVTDVDDLTALRRDLHAHPELGFQEQRTADLIARTLTEWGIPIHRGLGRTGVVGIVKNGTSPRAVGLRADIDALPITESNTFPHASTQSGKMHACGHDGHTAVLLGAAKRLAKPPPL